MTRVNPVQTVVTDVDSGSGKAIIECKSERATYTIEVREESPLVAACPVGSKITFSLDVETARAVPGEADQFTTTESFNSEPAVSEDDLEASRQALEAATGMKAARIADNPNIRDMLGLPDYSKSEAPKVGLLEAVNVIEGVGPNT